MNQLSCLFNLAAWVSLHFYNTDKNVVQLHAVAFKISYLKQQNGEVLKLVKTFLYGVPDNLLHTPLDTQAFIP